jgi:hypothetical protein
MPAGLNRQSAVGSRETAKPRRGHATSELEAIFLSHCPLYQPCQLHQPYQLPTFFILTIYSLVNWLTDQLVNLPIYLLIPPFKPLTTPTKPCTSP